MATNTCATASVAFLYLPTTIAALAAALAAAHLSVAAAVGRGASPRPRQRLRMLLLSSLLTSSCFPIPSPPLLLTLPTCFAPISSVFVIISYTAHAALQSCGVSSGAQQPLTRPVLRWTVGGCLCVGLHPPQVHRRKKVRPRALKPHAVARARRLPVLARVCVRSFHSLVRLLLGSCRARRGAEIVPKSRVALRTIFRIAFVVWTSHVSAYMYECRHAAWPILSICMHQIVFPEEWCTAWRVLCGILWTPPAGPLGADPQLRQTAEAMR